MNMGAVPAAVPADARADALPLTRSAVAHLGRVQGAGAEPFTSSVSLSPSQMYPGMP